MLYECPNCGHKVSENARTCPSCGESGVGGGARQSYLQCLTPKSTWDTGHIGKKVVLRLALMFVLIWLVGGLLCWLSAYRLLLGANTAKSVGIFGGLALGVLTSLVVGWPSIVAVVRANRRWVTFSRILYTAIAFGVAIYLLNEAERESLVLDPIEVPERFASTGLTSPAVTQLVRERIKEILERPDYINRVAPLSNSEDSAPTVELAATTFSLQIFVNVLRKCLDNPTTHLAAEIVELPTGQGVEIHTQISRSNILIDALSKIDDCRQGNGEVIESLAIQLYGLQNPLSVALYLKDTQQFDEALNVTDRMLFFRQDTNHLYSSAHITRASIDEQRDLLPDAEDELRTGIKMDPEYFAIHSALALLLQQEGKKAAKDEFETAINLNSWVPSVHINFGNWLRSHGEPKRALAEYRTAIRLEPGFYLAHENLGLLMYNDLSDRESAIKEFRDAIRLNPKFGGKSHYALGLALHDAGMVDEAAKEFRNSIWLQKTYPDPRTDEVIPDVHIHLAEIIQSQADRENGPFAEFHKNEAVGLLREDQAELQSAIGTGPGNFHLHNELGRAYFDLQQFDKAEVEFRAAIALSANEAAPHRNLSLALDKLGKKDEARNELAVAQKLQPH